jgi:hypothetical protein
MSLMGSIRASVAEVNRKYARPEIQTTLFVKICLVSLRVYLMVMVVLLVYAAVHSISTGNEVVGPSAQPPAASAPAAPPAGP